MKMMMLLLISTVVMLVGSAVASPTHHNTKRNLNHIIDLAENYNRSLTEEFFVDNVRYLTEGRCEDKFFCKVYDILHGHTHFGKRMEEEKLVRNLEIFINGENLNCTVLLEGVTPTGEYITIPKLLEYLIDCSRRRNTSKR